MDGGDITRRVTSAALSSSNIWRNNNTMDVVEDDEEALKWAAIERLPTYLRIRRGLLTETEGQTREVDLQNLGKPERQCVLDRLVNNAEEDNEKFLMKLKSRMDR